jgi:hypothetical protein
MLKSKNLKSSTEASDDLFTSPELKAVDYWETRDPKLQHTLRINTQEKLNWKKALRSMHEKIVVSYKPDLFSLRLERTIQQIANKPIIVLVCLNNTEEIEVLKNFTDFIKSRINIFKDILDSATTCLVRVHNGQPQLEVNSFENGALEFIGKRLELEAARSGSSLTSFRIENGISGVLVTFDISESPARSYREISR